MADTKKTYNKNKTNQVKPRQKIYKKAYIPNDMGGKAGYIEYQMSKEAIAAILNESKGNNAQKILCDYVNEQYGLKGYCIAVVVG